MGIHKTQGYNYLFGPVPSRRLGFSLGVDLVLPKTCTLDCVYCESGRTTVLTTERTESVPASGVIDELSAYLSSGPELDHITFSGCGEPLLNTGIRAVVDFIKDHYAQYPIALLTNGTLFYRDDVRRDVLDIDVIVASMDAVSESAFKRVNRPDRSLDPQVMIRGLMDLRREFTHELWLEIFIVPGVNDGPDELERLAEAARLIRPDRIQLNSLDRPGTESWVRAMDAAERNRIAGYFNGIDIIGEQIPSIDDHVVDENSDVHGRILAMIKRRPCTVKDLRVSLHADGDALDVCLERLVREGKVKTEKLERGVFYRIT